MAFIAASRQPYSAANFTLGIGDLVVTVAVCNVLTGTKVDNSPLEATVQGYRF